MPKSSLAKERQWRKILRRHQASGLGVRQFCQELQLSEPSFYAWRREIARRDQHAADRVGTKQGFDPSEQGKQRRPQGKRSQASRSFFLPLQLTSEAAGAIEPGPGRASSIELVHPRGHVVRIPADCDIECLRTVLGLLDR